MTFLLPSLVINQAGTRTIPLSMFFFFGQYTKQWDLALAGISTYNNTSFNILFLCSKTHYKECNGRKYKINIGLRYNI